MTNRTASRLHCLKCAAAAVFCGAAIFAATAAGAATPTVYTWGQLGFDGRLLDAPTTVSGISGTVAQIATSNSDLYVLTSTGTVWAMGDGANGELGNGGTVNSESTPVQVQFPAGVTIASLAYIGPFDTMTAIDTSGDVWGWGYNREGELCLGSATEELTPVKLPLTGVTQSVGAGSHNLYVSSGKLYACGGDSEGELGNGTMSPSMFTSPVAVSGLPSGTIRYITAAWRTSGALMSNGTYYDWGYGLGGQLGDGTKANSATPVNAFASLGATGANVDVVAVGLGGGGPSDGQTLAVDSTGHVWSWGVDSAGQLCNGTTTASIKRPHEISTPSTWVQVFSNGQTSYAIDSSGELWACGSNSNGQVGIGKVSPYKLTPKAVLSGVTQFSGTAKDAAALTG